MQFRDPVQQTLLRIESSSSGAGVGLSASASGLNLRVRGIGAGSVRYYLRRIADGRASGSSGGAAAILGKCRLRFDWRRLGRLGGGSAGRRLGRLDSRSQWTRGHSCAAGLHQEKAGRAKTTRPQGKRVQQSRTLGLGAPSAECGCGGLGSESGSTFAFAATLGADFGAAGFFFKSKKRSMSFCQ